MSNYTQIYSIVNAAVSDVLGSTAVRTKDSTGFVDLGQTVANANKVDAWFGALAARIGKTVTFVRLYERNYRRVLTDYTDFGAFVQKIYVDLEDACLNPVWATSDGSNPPSISTYDPYDVTTTVSVSNYLFGKKGTWAIEIKRPTKQIKEAFLTEAAMAAFIDGIYVQIETSLNIQLEAVENIAVATSIAESIHNGKATNLLQVYNATSTGVSLTVSNCLKNLDFLAFANKKIKTMREYMKKPSRKYNVAGYATFTPEDKSVLECLTEFVNSSEFFLESGTFHDSMVKLEGYTEVPYWMASGTDGDPAFAEASKITIKNADVYKDGQGDPITVEQTGVIAFLRDEENVKAYFGDREAWEIVNPRERTVIHGEQADLGFAVDPHANAWVFYIAD